MCIEYEIEMLSGLDRKHLLVFIYQNKAVERSPKKAVKCTLFDNRR